MSNKNKSKYITKKTSFGGRELILYSLDGNIWSSRPDELEKIQERHDNERIKLDPTKEDTKVEGKSEEDKVDDTDLVGDIVDEDEIVDSAIEVKTTVKTKLIKPPKLSLIKVAKVRSTAQSSAKTSSANSLDAKTKDSKLSSSDQKPKATTKTTSKSVPKTVANKAKPITKKGQTKKGKR